MTPSIDILVNLHYTETSNKYVKSVIFNNKGKSCLSFDAVLYQTAGDVIDRSSPTVIESACKEEFKDITEVLQSEENIGTVLNRISRTVEGKGKRSQESHEEKDVITCELILSYLSRSFASVLPMRGIGPLQWTESDRVNDMRKKENYDQAYANAEILRYYLDDEGEINRDEEQRIFETIVYPNVYTFE